MGVKKKIIFKHGTSFPTTAVGLGYLALFIWIYWIYSLGYWAVHEKLITYFLPVIWLVMQFSTERVILDYSRNNGYYHQTRFLYLPYNTVFIPFRTYSKMVLKLERVSFRVQQGLHAGGVEGVHNEKYYAIFGKTKSKEKELIVKGDKQRLILIINDFILPSKVPVYKGAIKEGYQFKDTTSENLSKED